MLHRVRLPKVPPPPSLGSPELGLTLPRPPTALNTGYHSVHFVCHSSTSNSTPSILLRLWLAPGRSPTAARPVSDHRHLAAALS